jgi:hypothetical protein
MKNPEVFYRVSLFLLFMYDFAVQFSPFALQSIFKISKDGTRQNLKGFPCSLTLLVEIRSRDHNVFV